MEWPGKPVIYLAGDSTMQSYGEDQRPQAGWGEYLLSALDPVNEIRRFHRENIREMQRHNTSDEVFLLVDGSCTLYVADGGDLEMGEVTKVELEPGKLYNIPKGVWHTHVTGPGAKIAIVENADVSSDNSDLLPVEPGKLFEGDGIK